MGKKDGDEHGLESGRYRRKISRGRYVFEAAHPHSCSDCSERYDEEERSNRKKKRLIELCG